MTRLLIAPLIVCALTACSSQSPTPDAAAAANPAPPAASPAVLDTPYTAEQIREAWVKGLSLKMVNETQFGRQFQRWTVVAADAEGADVEYLETDADGNPIGDAQVRRSLWVELRDHARFPAAACTRTEMTRKTPLGDLKGWSYTLRDAQNNVETEFFFAHDLPGAPVLMIVKQGGNVVQQLTQEGRELLPAG